MSFEIQIEEGHNGGSYFWFRPVTFKNHYTVGYDDVVELEEEFSIEEDDVWHFLSYFFFKYYDPELVYNKNRYDSCIKFEWNLTHNFFTYQALVEMGKEILEVAELLQNDYNNSKLNDIKERFSIYYMTSNDDPDHENVSESAIQKHVGVVINFYERFVKRISEMMKNNPNTNIISIMGP